MASYLCDGYVSSGCATLRVIGCVTPTVSCNCCLQVVILSINRGYRVVAGVLPL